MIPWVKSGELGDSRISVTEERISEDAVASSNAKVFPRGTLLVALYGATAGKVGVLDIDAATNQAVCAIFPGDIADSWYLFFALIHQRRELLGERYGGTQPNLSQRTLGVFRIPLPPLPEQRRIVAVLNAIQDAIVAQEDVIAAARELKRSLMQRLFTYGPYREPAETKETEIPKHWEVVELGNVLAATQYGMNQRAELRGTYRILRMNNLVEGKVDVSNLKYVELDTSQLQQFMLHPKDVLFNRTNSYDLVGKTAIFEHSAPYVFAPYLVRVVPDTARPLPEFLNYSLNHERTQIRLKKMATRG